MGFKPQSRVEALLHELCVKYGYCVPPDDWEALTASPPPDLDGFVEAVMVGGAGYDPSRQHLRNEEAWAEVSTVVRDWLFDQGQGKGTRSALPRQPA